MKHFWRHHRKQLRIIAYLVLIIAAFELGKAWASRSVNDFMIFGVFILVFLWLKLYEKNIL